MKFSPFLSLVNSLYVCGNWSTAAAAAATALVEIQQLDFAEANEPINVNLF